MTKKEELVEEIIQDLKENLYESQDYIFMLVREALMQRTIRDLKEINQ
jgi:hypothetical protein